MWNRTDGSILSGRRYIIVLATLVSSGLIFLMYALSMPAFAQDDGGGGTGGVNIEANNCSQIQIIFINQFLDDDEDDGVDGTTTDGTTTDGTTTDGTTTDGTTTDGTTTDGMEESGRISSAEAVEEISDENGISEEAVEDGAAEVSQQIGDISQNQVLLCLT